MKHIAEFSLVVILALALASISFADNSLTNNGASIANQETIINESTRRLLLDPRLVDNTRNARLTIGNAKKHSANPLFGEDKPWESRFDNVYANVIYDEQEKIYKCWYNPYLVDHSAKGMTREQRASRYKPPKNREMGLCYATSKDGINWEKPDLGLVDFEGSRRNNIIWRTRPGIWGHGSGVFKDALDLDPGRRYKAIFKCDLISTGTSADGINWMKVISHPEVNADGDTHNNAFWAPTLNKYVGITRTHGEHGRQVAKIESDDFVKWTKAEVVLEGLDDKQQMYAMPVFFYRGSYLGLLAVYDKESDRVWTELTWSSDTREWHRVCPGSPLIANSQEEMAYDWGCVYAAASPIVLDDEIRLYYGSSDGKHFGWRNGFFNLATLRPDGFAGYESIDIEDYAIVTTKPMVFQGKNLCISADLNYDWSSIKVNVRDEQGHKILVSKKIKRTLTDGPVEWIEEKDLQGKRVRLEFILDGAKLYSFLFSS